jgi:hypothetical protein
MKTVAVPARSERLRKLLDLARKENVILRADDGTEFILAEINDFNHEIELTRRNKKLMAFLTARAKQSTTLPLNAAKIDLGLD